MKKILLLALSFAFIVVGNISAYTITFNNYSQYPLQAWINYSGAGICSADMVSIPARPAGAPIVTKNHSTAACCTFKIEIRRTDLAGSTWWKFNPPATGAGIACKSFSVNINANPDGSLALTK